MKRSIQFVFTISLIFCSIAASVNGEQQNFFFTYKTETINESSARLHFNFKHHSPQPAVSYDLRLVDPEGKVVIETNVQSDVFDQWGQRARTQIPIETPLYWNAEQPNLYEVFIDVFEDNKQTHSIQSRVGLASYTIQKNKLLLNKVPIALNGVQYTLPHPNRQTPFTEQHYREDLALLKQMNCNAVRVINSIPDQTLFKLCDELGFYVVVDVERETLQQRVRETQTHPCVFAWNIDSTSMTDSERRAVIEKIKSLDTTRPVFVSTQSIQTPASHGDGVSVSNPPRSQWRLMGVTKAPCLAVDLLPAVGESFEGASFFTSLSRVGSSIIGGFYQQFANTKSNQLAVDQSLMNDRDALFDWGLGHDGLLNADRAPQLDFWQARQVFSPIQIKERRARFREGRSVELTLHNWNAFTNLSAYDVTWLFLVDGVVSEQGEIKINLDPQRSMKIAIRPQKTVPNPENNFHLVIAFSDENEVVYEHSVWLKPKSFDNDFIHRLNDLEWDENWRVNTSAEESRIDHNKFIFRTRTSDGSWFLLAREGNTRLITEGPFIQLNRELAPPEQLQALQLAAGLPCESQPQLLVTKRQVDRRGPDIEIKTSVSSLIAECSTEIEAQIDLLTSPYGFIDVQFSFDKITTAQALTEVGLTFTVAESLNQIGWLGDGPFPAYPGMERLSLPGLFRLAPIGSLQPGNRRNVQALVLVNESKIGLGVLLWNGDVSWRQTENGTRISINSYIAGRGSGADPSRFQINPDNINDENKTVFRLIPITPDNSSKIFSPWLSHK